MRVIHYLESARFVEHEMGAVELSGWAFFADGTAARKVTARIGPRLIAATDLAPRPDVRLHYSSPPATERCGYKLRTSLCATEKVVLSLVRDTDEVEFSFVEIDPTTLHGPKPRFPAFEKWATTFDPVPSSNEFESTTTSFSVLLPVFNTPPQLLRECISSVQQQHHHVWALHIVDDASTDIETRRVLEDVASDTRIDVTRNPRNLGIAGATNLALSRATGEFIVLLDHDDCLRPHTLSSFANVIRNEPSVDAIYSDEDKIDATGRRLVPVFKPGYSPEYLRGVMYIGHALCVRTSVARGVHGFDSHFDGIQDFEFMLRVSERTQAIHHIPKILYHWRYWEGSSALQGNLKGDMDAKQRLAVTNHLKRSADPRMAIALGGHRVRLVAPAGFEELADVLHIDAGDSFWEFARNHVNSSNRPVIIIMTGACADLGASEIRDLVALAQRSDTATVAPVLINWNRTVYASGATATRDGLVPVLSGESADHDGYAGTIRCNREVSFLLPICIAVRRALLAEERESPDWVTFSQRLSRRGLYHRVCASAHAIVTNPAIVPKQEVAEAVFRLGDPFFNPQFDRNSGAYKLPGMST
jgi:hypothetical protein